MRDNTEPEARQAGHYGKGSFQIDTTERNLVSEAAKAFLRRFEVQFDVINADSSKKYAYTPIRTWLEHRRSYF